MGGKEEMKKLDINKVWATTLILFLICVIVTAALAGTNYITAPRIAALQEQAQKDAMAVVLPAEKYENLNIPTDSFSKECYVALKDGEIIGYIATASVSGYGGEVKVMVGIDGSDNITAVKILSASDETPGLGMNITKKDYYGQYSGKKADFKDEEIVNVTGATISSTAAKNAVKEAVLLVNYAKTKFGEVK